MFWYLSFGTPEKWRGACLVETKDGATIVDATREAWRLGINPGGEAVGFAVPEEKAPELFRNRLMDVDDLRDFDRFNGGPGEVARIRHEGDCVCDECNESL